MGRTGGGVAMPPHRGGDPCCCRCCHRWRRRQRGGRRSMSYAPHRQRTAQGWLCDRHSWMSAPPGDPFPSSKPSYSLSSLAYLSSSWSSSNKHSPSYFPPPPLPLPSHQCPQSNASANPSRSLNMYTPWSACRMPIARLALLSPDKGPVQMIAIFGIAVASVVVAVVAYMGGGGEWYVGGGDLCCVLCCVARVDATHMGWEIMNVHHSTIILKKLHNLTYCTFV